MARALAPWLVSGGKIKFQPDGWQWHQLSFDGKLVVQSERAVGVAGSGSCHPALLSSDVKKLAEALISKPYVSGAFSIPGKVISASVTVDDSSLSEVSSFEGQGAVTTKTVGKFQVNCEPAKTPKGDPDPVTTKSGKWEVVQAGQSVAFSQ